MPKRPPFAGYARKETAEARRDYEIRRAADPKLAEAARIRNSSAWQQLRANFLACNPVCGSCRSALATQVHHLEPVERRPDLALTWGNLAPVCTRCHAACNSVERRGESTDYLFDGFKRVGMSHLDAMCTMATKAAIAAGGGAV